MPELVKRGFLYIAQPPLYLVTRKKRSEYVQDNDQLNNILIELGAGEVTVNVETLFRGKSCLLWQIEDAWAISVAPLLRDGVTWRVRHSDLANLLPSKRRRAVAAGGHGGEPVLGRHDVLARRQEHRALLFFE
jgi:hypothetical protein